MSQFNTKLFALELIGKWDFFHFPCRFQTAVTGNIEDRETNTRQTQYPCPNRDSNPGPLALQSSTFPLHHGGRHRNMNWLQLYRRRVINRRVAGSTLDQAIRRILFKQVHVFDRLSTNAAPTNQSVHSYTNVYVKLKPPTQLIFLRLQLSHALPLSDRPNRGLFHIF